MSLDTNLQNFVTRTATEIKALRTLINGNAANLSALTTSAETNLVAAINELDAAIDALSGGGSASTLDDLTDVVVSSATTGHILRHNGTNFVNVLGTTHFQPKSTVLDNTTASFTTADETKLDGIETSADVTDAANVGSTIHNVSAKTTPIGADKLALIDTEAANALKTVTMTALATYVTALVVDGAPGTLDTLNELAAAMGDNADFLAALNTAIAGKQASDLALTSIAGLSWVADRFPYTTGVDTFAMGTITAAGRAILDDADAAAQRTTLSVFSQAEIGSVTTDLVAVFEAGLL